MEQAVYPNQTKFMYCPTIPTCMDRQDFEFRDGKWVCPKCGVPYQFKLTQYQVKGDKNE
jgi:hypothetical protein